MRKESSNQFTEGLVSDLNPINTPNTVLTDALNATIITYDGNEFSLQNDRGNYELKNCRLKPNYIPVGLKEYGDILYIVSYNPLDNHVEIGSYPSPLMVSETEDGDTDKQLKSTIQTNIIDQGLTHENYTVLMENADAIVFDGDKFKLNPGDKYCLQSSELDLYKYETVDYYILGEDSNLHIVNDIIKLDEASTDPNYEHVPWTIPGWLNAKIRLAELGVAGINVKYFYAPKSDGDRTAYFSFNLRVNVSDIFLRENALTDWCENFDTLKDLGFRVYIEKQNGSKWESVMNSEYAEFSVSDKAVDNNVITLGSSNYTEWYEDCKIFWKNITGTIEGLSNYSVVRVKCVPFIREEDKYTILYDNLTQELIFDLTAVDNEPWGLGKSIYQFYKNENSVAIYADVTGPLISSYPIELKYSVYTLDNKKVLSGSFSDYTGIGENLFTLPISDKGLKAESIYIIEFTFESDGVVYDQQKRFLITSEVFSEFVDRPIYDRDITFGEWFNYYWKKFKSEYNITLTASPEKPSIIDYTSEYTEEDERYFAGGKYNTFFPNVSPGLSNQIFVKKGYSYPYILANLECKNSPIEGGVWDYIKVTDSFKYYNDINDEWVKCSTGKTVKVNDFISLILEYNKLNMPFNFLSGMEVWNATDPLKNFNSNSQYGDYTLQDLIFTLNVTVYGRDGKDEETGEEIKKTVVAEGSFRNREYRLEKSKGDYDVYLTSVFDDIQDWLQEALDVSKAPFLFLKTQYKLDGSTLDWKLNVSHCGQNVTLDGGFEFNWENDNSKTLQYLVFNSNKSGFPVVIPFSENDGDLCFENLCKELSIVTKNGHYESVDRYLLEVIEEKNSDKKLQVQHIRLADVNSYYGIDLLDESEKKYYIQENPVLYSSIFTDETENFQTENTFVAYENIFEGSGNFTYPNRSIGNNEGITELKGRLNILNSNSEQEYKDCFTSVYIREYDTRMSMFATCIGLYGASHLTINDSLIKALTQSYINYGQTGFVLEYASKSKTYKPLISKVKNKTWSSLIGSTWLLYHNLNKVNSNTEVAGSVDINLLMGGVWSENPNLCLEQKWPWIYGV